MISFENDYSEGAHFKILKRLVETDMVQVTGYGLDPFCEEAKSKIKQALGKPDADVWLLVGGTQTNLVAISTMLEPYMGVLAAETGHINVHEAGAIEYTGHKVITLPSHNGGKVDPAEVREYLSTFHQDVNNQHQVYPGMLYISFPTEYGNLYTKAELTELHEICNEYEIPLYVDGARLGYGLMSRQCDVTLQEFAELVDAFYIGGTKVGALCGEALVFTHNNTPKRFMGQMKQHGALLAKGRLLGIQFAELFTDDLYFRISKNAIDNAERLKEIFHEKGYQFYFESPTNEQFIVIENEKMKELAEKVVFSYNEKYDDTHSVIRFVTSWATRRENVEKMRELL